MIRLLAYFASAPAAPPLGDQGRIDSLYRRYRLQVVIAIALGYGLSYTGRLAIGLVKKPLIDGGIFTAADLGLIGSALFYAYAFGKLFNGFLADHASARRFLALGFLGSALANLGMGASTSVALAATFWGLNGWFQSMGAPGCVVAMTGWFSNRERGRYYGIWSTSHSIGEGLTFLVVGGVVAAFGWRAGYQVPALICAAAAVWMLFWVKDPPASYGLPAVADWRNDRWEGGGPKADAGASLIATQLSILKIPSVWVLALASAMAYVTRYAINSWGVLYLQEARGLSLPTAATLLFASTLAGIAGAVSYGFLSDKVFAARRPPASLIFGLCELAGLGLVFYGPSDMVTLTAGMILFGLGMTGLVTASGLFATDICPKRVVGAALGLIGVFSYLGAAIQEQVSGALIEKGTTMVGGVRHYDFGPVVLFWIGASAVSLVLAASLWRVKLRD